MTTRKPLVLGPFAKGLNTYDDPTAIQDSELVEALNFDPGFDGSMRSRPPFTDTDNPLPLGATGTPRLLGYYYDNSGNPHLIASDGLSSTWRYTAGSWSLITSTFAATDMAQFDGKAWLLAPVGESDPGGYWTPSGGFVADSDMPKGTSIASYKSRLWVSEGLGGANPTRIRYSKVLGQASFWANAGFFDVGAGDGQSIVKIIPYFDTMLVFRTKSIWSFQYGVDPATAIQGVIVPGVGLQTPRSLVAYENELYFMYDEKAYQFINNRATQINVKVPFRAQNLGSTQDPFHVSLFNNRILFSYYEMIYVYSLRTKTWTRWRSDTWGPMGQVMSSFVSGDTDEALALPSAPIPAKTYTNSFTNPSFETGSGTLDLRRNIAINPAPSGTTGWSSYGGAAISESGGEITVVCPGNASAEGAQIRSETDTVARPNVSGGMWVKAPAGTPLYVETRANGTYTGRVTTNFDATGDWQFVKAENSGSATTDANTHAVMVRTRAAVAVTFQLKHAIIELSPTLGGPLFYGGYQEVPDPDFVAVWAGTPNNSASILQAVPAMNVPPTAGHTRIFQSGQWKKSGTKSLRIIGIDSSTDTYASPGGDTGAVRLGMAAGKTYTAVATCRLSAPLVGASTSGRARGIVVFYKVGSGPYISMIGPTAPNTAGEYDLRFTFTLPVGTTEAFVRLYNGAPAGGGDVWWDDFALVEGEYDGPYFDGNTPDNPTNIYDWTGTANASTSTWKVLRSVPLLQIEDRFGLAKEEMQCVLQTKNYNFDVPGSYKVLFWWGLDAIFKVNVTGQVSPVTFNAVSMWGQLRQGGSKWGTLKTWAFPLSEGETFITTEVVPASGPSRKFVKFFKKLRFRQIFFRIKFTTDGSTATAPVQIFTISTYMAEKQTVSDQIS